MRLLILGVDLGGTKIGLSLWEGERRLRADRWPTTSSPEAELERIARTAREWSRELPDASIAAIGVSGGGPVDAAGGLLLAMPNRPGWERTPVCEVLSRSLGAPAAIENDANACALAEWRYGAGRGRRNLVFLTCSTGIGAGLVLDGRLYRGRSGLAGEVGHAVIIPGGDEAEAGGRGTLEAYASGTGIARRLRVRASGLPDAPTTAKELVERAREGDRFSIAFLEETAEHLALGVSHLVWILDPDIIVLGTIAVGAGDLLIRPLRRALERLVWPSLLDGLEIVPAALGADLGDWAAAAVGASLG